MASDTFAFRQHALSLPARTFKAVTPHDTNEIAETPQALYVGGSGTLVVIGVDDSAAVTFTNASGILPIRVLKVLATGTTATGIVALY